MLSTYVAPFAGAWIEIFLWTPSKTCIYTVAPFAGAWIEIYLSNVLPPNYHVAPFAGAWIEISSK